MNRQVALKQPYSAFHAARSDREAESVARLEHPNIARLYEYGPAYLVSELGL